MPRVRRPSVVASRHARGIAGSKHALLIGINYFGTSSELSGCINDILNVEFELREAGGYDDIVMLRDDMPSKPTRANILRAIDQLVSKAGAGSRLFFQYSGHGTYVKDTNGDEADGRDEALCPCDYERAGVITDDELRARLVDKLPAGCHLTCVIDACHSGTIIDMRWNYEDKSVLAKPLPRRKLPDTYVPAQWNTVQQLRQDRQYNLRTNVSVWCISGCRDTQTSADTVFNDKSTGAMTFALLRAIETGGGLGKVSLQDLLKNMSCFLRVYGYDQRPQLSSNKQLYMRREKFEW